MWNMSEYSFSPEHRAHGGCYFPSDVLYLKLNHSLLFLRSNTFAFWLIFEGSGSRSEADVIIFEHFGSVIMADLISELQSTKRSKNEIKTVTLYLMVFVRVSFLLTLSKGTKVHDLRRILY